MRWLQALDTRTLEELRQVLLSDAPAAPDPRLPGTIHSAAEEIERAGGHIHEQSKALNYREEGGRYVVSTERGQIRADVLVLACNAYLDKLDPQLASCVLPVGTYQVATAPLAPDHAES